MKTLPQQELEACITYLDAIAAGIVGDENMVKAIIKEKLESVIEALIAN